MLKNDKSKILILSIIIFCAFALIFLLGIGPYSYSEGYYGYTWYEFLDFVIVACGGAIFSLVSFIYSIKFYYDKIKRKKLFLIIGGIINFLIFYIILILIIETFIVFSRFYFCGIMITILYFVIVIVTAFASVNCFKLSKKYEKYLNPKKEKELQEQEIKKAFEKLKTLKMLLDSGAITQEEFDEKRKAYIDLI